MSEIADRYRTVAADFTARVEEVSPEGWDQPAPCEGWVARDVLRHLIEWVPAFFAGTISFPQAPSVDDDPVGAWRVFDDTVQAVLDDPERSAEVIDHPVAGRHRVDDALGQFVLGDVLIHTWDLARATGLDERLDPGEVHAAYEGMAPMADVLASSGHYGPRVPVADDADEQTRLLAVTGRTA